MHLFNRLAIVSALLLTALGLSACTKTTSQPTTSKTKPIHIVASLDFYGEVAQAVLGNHGTVTTVIKSASVDPHDFEPKPKEAAAVAHANFALANGLGYDAWLAKLVKSNANQDVTLVRVGEDVMDKQAGDNEHLWYDPETMARLANDLAKRFGKTAPAYRQAYQRNAAKYIRSLAPLQAQLKTLKQHSHQGLVDVSEPVFDYALTALGYRRNNQQFEMAVENGTDPSPKAIKDLQADIKQRKIAFFVNNRQTSDKTVKAMVSLARQHDVPVLNVTETLPAGKTYLSWMQAQYRDLDKIQAANS